jgi:acyl-CoA dehydrogenase
MALDFRRSWSDEDLDLYRDNVVRFIETEMLPHDEAARKRGHVGHEIWRKAGSLGLLCADIPEELGGAGGDFRHEAVFYEEDVAPRAERHEHLGAFHRGALLSQPRHRRQKRRYLPRWRAAKWSAPLP